MIEIFINLEDIFYISTYISKIKCVKSTGSLDCTCPSWYYTFVSLKIQSCWPTFESLHQNEVLLILNVKIPKDNQRLYFVYI